MDFSSIEFSPSLSFGHLSLGGSRLVLLLRRSGMPEAGLDESTSSVQSYDSIADINITLVTRRGRSRWD